MEMIITVMKCSHFVFCSHLHSIFSKSYNPLLKRGGKGTKKMGSLLCPERGLPFPPMQPIAHWVREHSLQESHRLKVTQEKPALLHSWVPWSVQARCQPLLSTAFSPASLPWTQRGHPGGPTPFFTSFAFSS